MSMLETQALTREFGGVIAVNKVDFFVEKNMITGLIGPNGEIGRASCRERV